MILSGAGSMACTAIMVVQRQESAVISTTFIIFNSAIVLVFSVINIISGINGLRHHNRRINSAVIIRLPEISIVLSLIAIILNLFNGTFLSYILLLAGTGILIPVIFIIASVKKSYK